jgi:hypothetical protein
MDEQARVVMIAGMRRKVVAVMTDTERYVVQEGWQLVSYPATECRVVER